MSSSMPKTLSECTAAVAGVMVADCTAVLDVLDQLIANNSGDSSTCVVLKRAVAAIGCMADAVQQAHGIDPGSVGGAADWLHIGSPMVQEAFERLSQKGGAA
jgi:hypothetical protein